jgi:hypothetical protein
VQKTKRLRFVLFLAAAFMYFYGRPISLLARNGDCDSECGPSVSCDYACEGSYDEPFNNHCGTHHGGSSAGWCIGECGDGFCNPYNDEDSGTCYDDCGVCGDLSCDGPEDLNNCPADCRSCGDGFCTGPWETCNSCGADCNPGNATCGSGSDPGLTEECDEGQVQNAEGYCCDAELVPQGDLGNCSVCGGGYECVYFHSIGYWYENPSWPTSGPHYLWHSGGIGWGCVAAGQSCSG